MADVIDLSGFEECEICGAMILADEDCPVCEDDARKIAPKKPITLKKLDNKRFTKDRRRKNAKH